MPRGLNFHESFVRFSDQLSSLTADRVSVKDYSAGEMVAALDTFDAVSSGMAELGWSPVYYWSSLDPAFTLLSEIPLTLTPWQHLEWRSQPDVVRATEDLAAEFNVQLVACGAMGQSGDLWSNIEIQSPEDMRGLKVRWPGIHSEILTRVGANPVTIPSSEIYPSMQTGILDGVNWLSPSADEKLGLHELSRNYYYPGKLEQGAIIDLIINLDTWNSMSSALQTQIELLCRSNALLDLSSISDDDKSALERFVNAGVNVQPLPTSVEDALLDAWFEVASEKSSQSSSFGFLFDSALEFKE